VILLARRADALASVKEACAAVHKESGVKSGGQFAAIVLDIANRQAVSSLWDKVPKELRNVDILGISSNVRSDTDAYTDTLGYFKSTMLGSCTAWSK
jgi:NADP-dependent 3-hydroxy acid dehydrogenase YdfG